MRKRTLFAVLAIVLALAGCESRTDKTDGGGALLSVSDFDGLPTQVGVNAAVDAGAGVSLGSITIQNIAKNINGATSSLMNVEMESYEVRYSRADGASRVPTNLVRQVFGVAPINGTQQYDNLPIFTFAQFEEEPLSDLQFVNGGLDQETGKTTIVLNIEMRFFGRTLSGDRVQTEPISFTVDFVP